MARDPRSDPRSIGNRLMARGLSTAQLDRALNYQADHADILLGEACVRLDLITRVELEVVVAMQQADHNGGARALARIAAERTKTLARRVDHNVLTAGLLLTKLAE